MEVTYSSGHSALLQKLLAFWFLSIISLTQACQVLGKCPVHTNGPSNTTVTPSAPVILFLAPPQAPPPNPHQLIT